ncbi:thiamine phosphate synthase [Vallitalea okinawensis]|uniref:thiamine phosphate synthase n=1 Tax=Vallitalea okinawensis TaxID=2078660 RepID=UPI000CFC452A|nr:thiamine phosphate synthase [Vallitalea okinawensis]
MNSNKQLYLVTDHRIPFDLLEKKVKLCLEAGIDVLQYRNKYADTRVQYEESSRLKKLCHEFGVPFIINDRIDVALSIDADGIHLGQSDMPLDIARQLLGPDKLLGASVHNSQEAYDAIKAGADHVGVGALFHTSTKVNTKLISLIVLEEIRATIKDIPIYGIGGITPNNLTSEYLKILDGAAIISAILNCSNPTTEVKKFNALLKKQN